MLNYKFEDGDTKAICEKYNINKREFEGMRDVIGTFYSDVRIQHLSSIMRSLEIKGRHITKNNSFRIDWGELQNDSKDAHSMWKDGRFIIYLPKNINNDEERYIVAHELGELFYILVMIEDLVKGKTFSNQGELKSLIEKECSKAGLQNEFHNKANIFGVVVIQERSDFYRTKVPSMNEIINKPVKEIIEYFKTERL